MERLKKEESTFLSICSPRDLALLTSSEEMTLQEFERITYITMALDYVEYTLALHKRYMNFTIKLTKQIDRENKLLMEYPAYYMDEQISERNQKWIDDFYNGIPADRQKYYQAKLKPQTESR